MRKNNIILTTKNICMLLQLKDYLISTFINLILKVLVENLPYRESIGFSEKGWNTAIV